MDRRVGAHHVFPAGDSRRFSSSSLVNRLLCAGLLKTSQFAVVSIYDIYSAVKTPFS